MTRFTIAILAALTLSAATVDARAATVTGSFTDIVTGTNDGVNLTTLGTTDWAYWDHDSNTTPGTGGVPTNSKLIGTLIGSMTAIDTNDASPGAVRGSSTGVAELDYTFTDGTLPVSGTNTNATGLFNTQLNDVGAGVSVPVVLPTTDTYTVYLWGAGFEATVEVRALLPGAADYVHSTFVAPGGGPKPSFLHTLSVTPDNPGDTLTLRVTLLVDPAGGSSNVLISGVAVAIIPAPAALPAGLALCAMIGVRRRPRAAIRR